ncbi:uncharacterized protein LOC107006173 [Solanum pennellii]|uniref:Uncharacterized protein LOC107006173 n=1 Tax=Solanum pennellii TaxID=28526 RepID=A0ABM1FQN0_SOLPN|nr:uncharacterized protein LOC107006173 [Solanum pennellii]
MMNWSSVSKPEVFLHEDGYYLIKFQKIRDMNEILFSGTYTINNRPIILKQWCPEFDFGSEFLTEIPLWVNFPKLPLNCWGVGSLSRIASAIEVPLFADDCTTKQTRISYARMLVEVNVTKAISQKIAVVDSTGKTFMQDVVLEWRPQYCDKFQKIGHLCQVEPEPKEEMPRRRRPWKKVTQTCQYKGPISQKTEQEKMDEQRQENNLSPRKNKQEEEQKIGKKLDQQTPRNNGEQSYVDRQLELSLANFPILKAIPTRNGFESLMHNKMASLSIDRGLVETRVKDKNLNSILKGIAPGWKIPHNYTDSPNGRIWLIWDDNWYEIKMINSSAQLLHCQVNERSKDYQFILTVVYGFNTVEQRKSLWQEMNAMSKGISQPWLIVGDFNAILSTKDRLDGVPVTNNEIKDFGDCVRDMGITELQWTGNYYTWTNKQCGRDRISSRIHRAFGNDEWMDKRGHVNV